MIMLSLTVIVIFYSHLNDPFIVIESVISWEDFEINITEVQSLAQPEKSILNLTHDNLYRFFFARSQLAQY
jgi:hypothetical protein